MVSSIRRRHISCVAILYGYTNKSGHSHIKTHTLPFINQLTNTRTIHKFQVPLTCAHPYYIPILAKYHRIRRIGSLWNVQSHVSRLLGSHVFDRISRTERYSDSERSCLYAHHTVLPVTTFDLQWQWAKAHKLFILRSIREEDPRWTLSVSGSHRKAVVLPCSMIGT